MDLNIEFTCEACGRPFVGAGPLNYHMRSCRPGKRQLQGALSKVHQFWQDKKLAANKRRRPNPTLELELGSRPPDDHGENHASGSQLEDNSGDTTNVENMDFLSPVPLSSVEDPAHALEDERPLALRKTRRESILPQRFRDILPQPPPPLPQQPLESAENPLSPAPHPILRNFKTRRNIFGLAKIYRSTQKPTHDPDQWLALNDLYDSTLEEEEHPPKQHHIDLSTFHPYPNESSFLLGDWYWNSGAQKSQASFKNLIEIITAPHFKKEEIVGTAWSSVNRLLGQSEFDEISGEWEDEDAGWVRTQVAIEVPFHSRMKDKGGSQQHIVGDLYHRSIVSVVKEKLANSLDVRQFHYEPYQFTWIPTQDSDKICIHGELYTSPSFITTHEELQSSPGEPGCDLPRLVVAIMFWSDATHLTTFGNAKLWPLYMYFGNESKYRRCKPSLHLANHIAYFRTLPDSFKDFASEHIGRGPNKAFMTYCHREAFHTQLGLVFDNEFVEAYTHGIVVHCSDNISRRFYPRIFTHSADYPEKILLASIRNRGACPCPRCLVKRSQMKYMGTAEDMRQRKAALRLDNKDRQERIAKARSLIYEKRTAVNGKAIESLLKPDSLVPISNAFSSKLSPLGFQLFPTFVVDLLHEFELGVWKATITHLVRMLHSINLSAVNEMDFRYRQVPTFGKGTIRKFSSNISEFKRPAARDYEDLLQCALPVFEGLFPEPHDAAILDLLFLCAHWQGLAKLRMHSDLTLEIMDNVTITLGGHFRFFVNIICPGFKTQELPREAAARARRSKQLTTSADVTTASGIPSADGERLDGMISMPPGHTNMNSLPSSQALRPSVSDSGPPIGGRGSMPLSQSQTTGRRPKTLNLNTYKYHSLGDYSDTIRKFGTTDSYSTELGELEHRRPKSWYSRTDRKEYEKQLARIEQRQNCIHRIRAQNFPASSSKTIGREEDPAETPTSHYWIGKTENFPEHIGQFVQKNAGDPATQDFIPKLKQHLLPRLAALLSKEDSSSSDDVSCDGPCNWQDVVFKHDRMYTHKIMRVNYTTYDIRRAEDIIHTGSSKCDIMVLNPRFSAEDLTSQHPFWYARVIGIYHVNAIYIREGNNDYQPSRLDFLWVRWFHFKGMPNGWSKLRLDQLHFPSLTSPESFGFLDPDYVLHGAHLIPLLSGGKVHSDGKNASHCARDGLDWKAYVINRFVDRDMIIRHYWGLGVEHTYARISTATARSLYIKPNHSPEEHTQENITQGLPEDADEESELGDDDMVYVDGIDLDGDGDGDSDVSSLYGLEAAETDA